MFTVALDPESTDGHCTALCLNREELVYLMCVFGKSGGKGLEIDGCKEGMYDVLTGACEAATGGDLQGSGRISFSPFIGGFVDLADITLNQMQFLVDQAIEVGKS